MDIYFVYFNNEILVGNYIYFDLNLYLDLYLCLCCYMKRIVLLIFVVVVVYGFEDYYLFGLKHTNYNTYKRQFKKEDPPPTDAPPTSIPGLVGFSIRQVVPGEMLVYKYKYNGKEYQDELGLNVTAMDFRMYDNALGRFHNIDAMTEVMPSLSPYRFAFNNPVIWKDPSVYQKQVMLLKSIGI